MSHAHGQKEKGKMSGGERGGRFDTPAIVGINSFVEFRVAL